MQRWSARGRTPSCCHTSIRIPCVSPPPPSVRHGHGEHDASLSSAPCANRPWLLPLPVLLLLLLLFFSGLTAMALGSSGVEALSARFTSLQPGSDHRDGVALHSPVLQGQASPHRSTAAGQRTRTSFPSWLPLPSLPAVSAVPFQ
jgi:hypothetical protein